MVVKLVNEEIFNGFPVIHNLKGGQSSYFITFGKCFLGIMVYHVAHSLPERLLIKLV